jgi:YNFM family putative membrane transporter
LHSSIASGTPAFRRTNLALFSAGFATFALLYCVQPILPEFARQFHVSPATSSLALSLTTGGVAFAVLVVGGFSEAWGRRPVIVASLLVTATLTIASALMPAWTPLLVTRALVGVALAGLPAAAIAYVNEEIHSESVGLAMGLYIAGTSIGGMGGRLVAAVLTDLTSWRVALATIGVLGLAAAAICWWTLPRSVAFRPRPFGVGTVAAAYRAHLADPILLTLYAEAFLVMGAFVTMYNYVVFRLMAPPFSYGQAMAGSVSVLYLLGTVSSAWMGSLTERLGRGRILNGAIGLMLAGVALTLPDWPVFVISGIGIYTFGFFAVHVVCSGWVGWRASEAKGQAASLYLFAFYIGSSIAGPCGGIFWTWFGWYGLAAFLVVLLSVALLLARGVLERRPPEPEIVQVQGGL